MRKEVGALEEAASLPMKFFHGSSKRHAIGSVLKARRRKTEFQDPRPFRTLGAKPQDVEGFVESYRPRGYPSRTKTIYLVTDPRCVDEAGGSGEHVYEVRPLSMTLRVHFGWFGKLLGLAFDGVSLKSSRLASRYAKSYWRGVQCPDCVGVWEVLTERAQIIRDMGHIDEADAMMRKSVGRRYRCG